MDVTKEIICVLRLLESLRIKVNLSLTVRGGNTGTGAMCVSKNINTTSSTKHVDVHTKYVNGYYENEMIRIIFVQSTDNDADIVT